jgi:hypothetical protein
VCYGAAACCVGGIQYFDWLLVGRWFADRTVRVLEGSPPGVVTLQTVVLVDLTVPV